ncbi:hypothetical protein MTBBW1_1730002 [Desulfamplus magnetovallimortis]|uniref:Uncharacterized protein n=1 Tax=Desulfamplus magnetovallimortis TaxID=1246637 RepID=A0A1W1H9R3_9BACT|nr:hypothetical protein MTBBW1_1730002 [Desulfamplus magnetovallimortis]
MTATIEGMKVFMKTAICGDFHITYMADDRHNRKDESLYENSHLRGLSYKTYSKKTPIIF